MLKRFREVADAKHTAQMVVARSEFIQIPGGPLDYEYREIDGADGYRWIVAEVFDCKTGKVLWCIWSPAGK